MPKENLSQKRPFKKTNRFEFGIIVLHPDSGDDGPQDVEDCHVEPAVHADPLVLVAASGLPLDLGADGVHLLPDDVAHPGFSEPEIAEGAKGEAPLLLYQERL